MLRSVGFWSTWGAFMLGAAIEKWFVASGWPDVGVTPAVIYSAAGLVAITIAAVLSESA